MLRTVRLIVPKLLNVVWHGHCFSDITQQFLCGCIIFVVTVVYTATVLPVIELRHVAGITCMWKVLTTRADKQTDVAGFQISAVRGKVVFARLFVASSSCPAFTG